MFKLLLLLTLVGIGFLVNYTVNIKQYDYTAILLVVAALLQIVLFSKPKNRKQHENR